ncbi:MAG: preprotein translocase subunit YajC [Butyricicoccus sp.]
MNFNVMDAAGTAATGGWGSMLIMLVVYGGLIAAMYFIFFRPQSKKKKKEAEMRKNAQVGDEVTTIGGICGRTIAVKDETESVIIETGSDRARLRQASTIGSVDTIHEKTHKIGIV